MFEFLCLIFNQRRKYRRRRYWFILICWLILIYYLYRVCTSFNYSDNLTSGSSLPVNISKTNAEKNNDDYQTSNYFQSEKVLLAKQLLVDNPGKCRIPDIDPWSEQIKRFVHSFPDPNCDKKLPRITYVNGTSIVVNLKLLQSLGYSEKSVVCCYRSISRKHESISNFTGTADRTYITSTDCITLEEVTTPKSRFVKVECTFRSWFSEKVIYTNHHGLSILPEEDEDALIREKLAFWKRYQVCHENGKGDVDIDKTACASVQQKPPPNVLLLGIDSTSRINFRRFMNKTVALLERVEAVEMGGYTKVGDNTIFNLLPILTSMSLQEAEKTCSKNYFDPLDDCPFIWKEFSSAKYLTGHFEESPGSAIFNVQKLGFVKSPVDIYPRSLMIAFGGLAGEGNIPFLLQCAGYERSEAFILKFVTDIMAISASKNVPTFFTMWLTARTHDDMNGLQLLDDAVEDTLLKLEELRLLQNTVIILISDHGYRYMAYRRTFSGWYEEKLPALWFYLPPLLKDRNPEWLPALKHSSRQLSSPFDVHTTLHHILKESSPEPELTSPNSSSIGQSLLNKSPPRQCHEAGVPADFCACDLPMKYDSDEELIHSAGEAIVEHINGEMPSVCKALNLSGIITSGIIRSEDKTSSMKPDHRDSLIIGIRTSPGDFLYEARVEFSRISLTFTNVTRVLRTSSIKRVASCIPNEDKNYYHQLICYCEDWVD